MSRRWPFGVAVMVLAGLVPGAASAQQMPGAAGVVRVYSYREPKLTEGLFAAFQWTTGIKVDLVHKPTGLVERMVEEQATGGADVLLTNDAGLLVQARTANVTEALKSPILEQAVPAALRDKDNHWFALSRNARVILAAKARVTADAISYEELADHKWKGRICMRSGAHSYNVTLVAALMAHHGPARTELWLKGVKANLAMKPEGGDRDQIRRVHEGQCDLALVNSYYLGALQARDATPEQQAWAKSVKLIFPNRSERGVHVNISGMALAAKAPNRDNAVRLMEFLASAMAQQIYANRNHEYPVNALGESSPVLREWGPLKSDELPIGDIVRRRKEASDLVQRVLFDAVTQ
ncbi:MAG: extracellular solute-binding protein [Hyphomicrobiaceae bacterium]